MSLDAGKKMRDAAKAAERARRAELELRNDRLLGNEDFRDYLRSLADAGKYLFGESSGELEFMHGYRAAMRDAVNAVVFGSARGPAFLADYVARKKEALKRNEAVASNPKDKEEKDNA